MKKETRTSVCPVVVSGMNLSSLASTMRRSVYFLMVLCLSLNLQAHEHNHDHHSCSDASCSHTGHHHSECSVPQQNNGEHTSVRECGMCNGTGYCFLCGGSGAIFSMAGGMAYCPGCVGSGRCRMCNGAGVNVITTNSNTGVGYFNGQMIVLPVNGSNNSGSVNSNSGYSSSRSCRVCNGTGRKISERWMGSQTSQRKWCGTCNEYVIQTHQHVRCDNCNGTGRVKY